jgi:concentrative nucleoside transporter, CNT family
MKNFRAVLLFIFLGIFNVHSQSINKEWRFETTDTSAALQEYFSLQDKLHLDEGRFSISTAEGEEVSGGDYLYQNNLLVFFYDPPNDTIKKFRINELTETSLVLSDNDHIYTFTEAPTEVEELIPAETAKEIIPSQGLTVTSVWRGILGMFSLLLLAFFFSSKRSAINWRTVGVGLAAQLLLAIGVLKVTFIKNIFEFVGNIFVLILDFTKAGSEFLLGGLMEVDSFGFIFLFQVLPTIIFFSALTSVLFYLGIVQVIVRGLAWVLTKLMGISGAESLSVAGNIFLGQTEAPLLN